MLKAMLITFAKDLYVQNKIPTPPAIPPNPGSPVLARTPDKYQGWGRVDLTEAFKTDHRYYWDDQTKLVTCTGCPAYLRGSLVLTIKDLARPVIVTLVWTDSAGAIDAAKELVNDIDLSMFGASNGLEIFQGNQFDTTTGFSKKTDSGHPLAVDRTNNVEVIRIMPSAITGSQIHIQVTGAQISADCLHPWNPTSTLQQDFALFVDNVLGP
jgi:hypothetical protein